MIDDRVRYYFALLDNTRVISHGLMLHDEAWQWSQTFNAKEKTIIQFFSKEDYNLFLKEKDIQ